MSSTAKPSPETTDRNPRDMANAAIAIAVEGERRIVERDKGIKAQAPALAGGQACAQVVGPLRRVAAAKRLVDQPATGADHRLVLERDLARFFFRRQQAGTEYPRIDQAVRAAGVAAFADHAAEANFAPAFGE